MIQSRFQKQHASKHPQQPTNGGSGPKPMPASRDATSNIRKNAGKGGVDVGLRVPVHIADSDGEYTEEMRPEDFNAMNAPLFRGRTRGQQKPAPKRSVNPIDSAIHVLMDDTRAGDAKGARSRFQEFTRQNVLRGKKK